MRRVSKEEFYNFIKNYPHKLERDVYAVCEPASVTYNDFSIADKWPDSVVARTRLYDNDPNSSYYTPEEEREYYIAE